MNDTNQESDTQPGMTHPARPRRVDEFELDRRLSAHNKWVESEKTAGKRFVSDAREDLGGAHLSGRNLKEAELMFANLCEADLFMADLSGANLYGADLTRANLKRAVLDGTDVQRATLVYCGGLFGRLSATCLSTVKHAQWADYGEIKGCNGVICRACINAILSLCRGRWSWLAKRKNTDFAHWSFLRIIGAMPIFTASWTGAIAATIYASVIRGTNSHIAHWHAWADEHQNGVIRFLSELIDRISQLPVAWHFGLQLLAFVLLAVGATIYIVRCPDQVKEATEIDWTRRMNQPLIEYRSAMYSDWWCRYVCFYAIFAGGLYTLGYFLWQVVRACSVFFGAAVADLSQ